MYLVFFFLYLNKLWLFFLSDSSFININIDFWDLTFVFIQINVNCLRLNTSNAYYKNLYGGRWQKGCRKQKKKKKRKTRLPLKAIPTSLNVYKVHGKSSAPRAQEESGLKWVGGRVDKKKKKKAPSPRKRLSSLVRPSTTLKK